MRLQEVDVQAEDAARLESLIGPERMARFEQVADAAQASLAGHAVLNVNSTAAEGFGLTVAEAMWKSRPIVASAVGAIRDQVTDGEHGLLIDDPHDLPAFGAAVERLLRDPQGATRLGSNARTRAAAEFLGDRHLEQYGALFTSLG